MSDMHRKVILDVFFRLFDLQTLQTMLALEEDSRHRVHDALAALGVMEQSQYARH